MARTLFILSIYTIFLAWVIEKPALYPIAIFTFLLTGFYGLVKRFYENRKLPVENVSHEEEKPELVERKQEPEQPEIKVIRIEKDDTEIQEQKKH